MYRNKWIEMESLAVVFHLLYNEMRKLCVDKLNRLHSNMINESDGNARAPLTKIVFIYLPKLD